MEDSIPNLSHKIYQENVFTEPGIVHTDANGVVHESRTNGLWKLHWTNYPAVTLNSIERYTGSFPFRKYVFPNPANKGLNIDGVAVLGDDIAMAEASAWFFDQMDNKDANPFLPDKLEYKGVEYPFGRGWCHLPKHMDALVKAAAGTKTPTNVILWNAWATGNMLSDHLPGYFQVKRTGFQDLGMLTVNRFDLNHQGLMGDQATVDEATVGKKGEKGLSLMALYSELFSIDFFMRKNWNIMGEETVSLETLLKKEDWTYTLDLKKSQTEKHTVNRANLFYNLDKTLKKFATTDPNELLRELHAGAEEDKKYQVFLR